MSRRWLLGVLTLAAAGCASLGTHDRADAMQVVATSELWEDVTLRIVCRTGRQLDRMSITMGMTEHRAVSLHACGDVYVQAEGIQEEWTSGLTMVSPDSRLVVRVGPVLSQSTVMVTAKQGEAVDASVMSPVGVLRPVDPPRARRPGGRSE
jgi:hypothetical protein